MISRPPRPRAPIRRLDPGTVERIAAGEVVERPASVVKELLENALDAGATTVTVRLVGGGLDRIEVADDGEGIPPEELELAVERHATSKLPPEGPVERIDSLGFRGEALAAIATVSRLRLLSRPPDRAGAEGLTVAGGTPTGRSGAARAPGTSVEVTDLFFNTPARRKFLRRPASEQVEVLRTVERTYLARPTVTIRVESEGQERAVYPASSDLRDAAARVLGTEFLRGSFAASGPIPGGRVHGYLGRPPLAAASSWNLHLAVNGRPVQSRPILQAVRAAFGDYLPRPRFPIGVLHLELPPESLDVNVHPTKREVRLAREREVVEALRLRVRESLVDAVGAGDPSIGAPAGASPGSPYRLFGPAAPAEGSAEVAEPVEGARTVPRGQLRLDLPAREETAGRAVERPGRPRLRLLGCVQSLYWIAESDEGLVLIDQHAASERLLFESLLKDRALARQTLVQGVVVRLTGVQRATLAAHSDDVSRAGFEVDAFGPEEYRLRSLPSFRGRRVSPSALAELLDELAGGGRATEPDGLRERTAATLACHAAIRAGDVVSLEEFGRVLDALGALVPAPSSCPHGRPILLGIPRGRIDRWFLRSGV